MFFPFQYLRFTTHLCFLYILKLFLNAYSLFSLLIHYLFDFVVTERFQVLFHYFFLDVTIYFCQLFDNSKFSCLPLHAKFRLNPKIPSLPNIINTLFFWNQFCYFSLNFFKTTAKSTTTSFFMLFYHTSFCSGILINSSLWVKITQKIAQHHAISSILWKRLYA